MHLTKLAKRTTVWALTIAMCLSFGFAALFSVLRASAADGKIENVTDLMEWSEDFTETYNLSATNLKFADGTTINSSESAAKTPKDTTETVGVKLSSGDTVGETLLGKGINFKQTMSGTFEINYRVLPTQNSYKGDGFEEDWQSANTSLDVREIGITITDTDTNESFTIYVAGGRPERVSCVNARVGYGDVKTKSGKYSDEDYAGTAGLSYNLDETESSVFASGALNHTILADTSYSNSVARKFPDGGVWWTVTDNTAHSTRIGFDPATRKIYGYSYGFSTQGTDTSVNKRVIIDLSDMSHYAQIGDSEHKLADSTFENYTVKMTVTNIAADRPANIMLYSLNGQSLAGENGVLTDNRGPSVIPVSEALPDGVKGQAYKIPAMNAYDVIEGVIPFNGKVTVYGPDNSPLSGLDGVAWSDSLSFTPEDAGEYRIVYSAPTDSKGNDWKTPGKGYNTDGVYARDVVEYNGAPMGDAERTVRVNVKELSVSADDLIDLEGFTVEDHNYLGSQYRDSEGNAVLPYDNRSGIYLKATAAGDAAEAGKITFKKPLSGLFELDFRVMAEKSYPGTNDWWEGGSWASWNREVEVRELAITITDSDTGESFTVYLSGGTNYATFIPSAKVGYGVAGESVGAGLTYATSDIIGTNPSGTFDGFGAAVGSIGENTRLWGTSFSNQTNSNGAEWGNGGYPTVIGFDPITKEVYGYSYNNKNQFGRRVIADLSREADLAHIGDSAGALNGSSFENYTVSVQLTNVTVEKTPQLILYTLNGQSLGGDSGTIVSNTGPAVTTEVVSRAAANKAYKIPAPQVFSLFESDLAFNGKIRVEKADGTVVMQDTAWSQGLSFTPTEAGQYYIVYHGATDSNGNGRKQYTMNGYTGEEVAFRYPLEVLASAEAPTVSRASDSDLILKNRKVNVGAIGVSALDLNGSSVQILLSVTKNGAPYGEYTDYPVTAEAYISFDENGEYVLTYTATDYIGQSGTQTFNVTVTDGKVEFSDDAAAPAIIGADYIVGKDDLIVYNYQDGVVSDYTLSVQVYDGSAWKDVTAGSDGTFNLKSVFETLAPGQYRVKYIVVYTLEETQVSQSVEREVTLQDKTGPVITEGELTGAVSDPEEDTAVLKHFRAVIGGSVTIPQATAEDNVDETSTVGVSLKGPDDNEAVAADFNDTVNFDKEGVWLIVYTSQDKAGNASTLALQIEVKASWFTVSAENAAVSFGNAYTPAAPNVVDQFTGETITDFTAKISVMYGGSTVETNNGAFTPEHTGVYTVTYTVTYNGQEETCEITLTVSDDADPVIAVQGEYAKNVETGTEITILSSTVTDNYDSGLTAKVSVSFGGSVVNVTDGKFVADREGVYVITYTVSDTAGNTATQSFEITVKAPASGGNVGLIVGLSVGGAVVIAGVVVAVILIRKKKAQK